MSQCGSFLCEVFLQGGGRPCSCEAGLASESGHPSRVIRVGLSESGHPSRVSPTTGTPEHCPTGRHARTHASHISSIPPSPSPSPHPPPATSALACTLTAFTRTAPPSLRPPPSHQRPAADRAWISVYAGSRLCWVCTCCAGAVDSPAPSMPTQHNLPTQHDLPTHHNLPTQHRSVPAVLMCGAGTGRPDSQAFRWKPHGRVAERRLDGPLWRSETDQVGLRDGGAVLAGPEAWA